MCTHYAQSCQYFPVKHCVAPGVASNDGVVRYTVILNRLLSVFKVSRECQNVKKKKQKKNPKQKPEDVNTTVVSATVKQWKFTFSFAYVSQCILMCYFSCLFYNFSPAISTYDQYPILPAGMNSVRNR